MQSPIFGLLSTRWGGNDYNNLGSEVGQIPSISDQIWYICHSAKDATMEQRETFDVIFPSLFDQRGCLGLEGRAGL